MKKSVLKLMVSLLGMALITLSFTSFTTKGVNNIPLNTETLEGKSVSNKLYEENELTLVNVMATWCGPCVKEIPELNEIHNENNGFGVIGIVYDTYNSKTGAINRKAIFDAESIVYRTGATYTFVLSNEEIINATLKNRAAILPMSFIVDKNGNIVEGPIAGAKKKSEWLSILKKAKQSL